MNKSTFGWSLVIGAALLALNLILFNTLLRGRSLGRLDLTEGKHFSLSDTTKKLMAELEEPSEIIYYYSTPDAQHDKLRPLVGPMCDLLSEFESASDGRINVRLIELDKTKTKEIDEAENAFGVRPFQVEIAGAFEAGIRNNYYSLVVAVGSEYEHFNLEKNAEELLKFARPPSRPTDFEVELGDIENVVVKSLRKLARGFGSVPGALAGRDKTATLTVFITPKELPKHLEGLKETIEKVTSRLERESAGRLKTTFRDPFEGKAAEEREGLYQDLYSKFRIKPIPRDIFGDSVYYSWLVLELDNKADAVPLYTQSGSLGEADVKTEIETALKRMIPGFLPAVGFSAPTPESNPMMMQMGRRPPPSEFAAVERSLESSHTIKSVGLDAPAGLPRDLTVLAIVRPGDLSDRALFEIDQFLMRGGRLVVCADHFSLNTEQTMQTGAISLTSAPSSKISDFLAHYGVSFAPEMLLDTRSEYLEIPGEVRYVGGMPVQTFDKREYPYFVRIPEKDMAEGHAITTGVVRNAFLWATPLDVSKAPEGIKATILASTTENASTSSDAGSATSIISTGYKPPKEAKRYPVAALLEGKFKSYFADKPIPGLDQPADDGNATPKPPEKPTSAATGSPLKECREPTSIIVIGDTDFLSQGVFRAFAQDIDLLNSNLALFRNALDYGNTDEAIIRQRNRPPLSRPLLGLEGKSPEDRESAGQWTFFLVTALSLGAVALLGALWFLKRSRTAPLPLLKEAEVRGAQS